MQEVINLILMTAKERNISNQEICRILGANRNKVDDWKKGKSSPSVEEVSILAKNFNVSTDYLSGLTDDPRPAGAKKEPAPETGSFEWLRQGLIARGVIGESDDLTDEQLSIALRNLDELVKILGKKAEN